MWGCCLDDSNEPVDVLSVGTDPQTVTFALKSPWHKQMTVIIARAAGASKARGKLQPGQSPFV